jgi:hypothetical protein
MQQLMVDVRSADLGPFMGYRTKLLENFKGDLGTAFGAFPSRSLRSARVLSKSRRYIPRKTRPRRLPQRVSSGVDPAWRLPLSLGAAKLARALQKKNHDR